MAPLAAAGLDGAGPGEWVAAMRAGDFAHAWEISDRDLLAERRGGLGKHEGPRHLQRIWRGEPLQGQRVFVRCYHGLGDTIQFARFLSPLRAVAAEVTLWCQPELLGLMAGVNGVDRVLPLHDGRPEIDFDVDIEIMEIPHAIHAGRGEVEMRRPYLKAPPNDDLERTADSRFAIGLVWNVGDWDRRRVIPSRLLGQLNHPGVQLYSLQRGDAGDAAAGIGAIDISTPRIDVLASHLQMLDLCVCPDTMVAHLSAALGRETWIMLHSDCDWRWPASDDRTIWYPTVRLFRQRAPDSWNDVVAEVSAAIAERAGPRR
jgi:hypothetical protein